MKKTSASILCTFLSLFFFSNCQKATEEKPTKSYWPNGAQISDFGVHAI